MKNFKPSKSGALSNSFMDKNVLEYLFGNARICGWFERSGKPIRQHALVMFCLSQGKAGTLFGTQNAKHWLYYSGTKIYTMIY